jgi:hypothetical protein
MCCNPCQHLPDLLRQHEPRQMDEHRRPHPVPVLVGQAVRKPNSLVPGVRQLGPELPVHPLHLAKARPGMSNPERNTCRRRWSSSFTISPASPVSRTAPAPVAITPCCRSPASSRLTRCRSCSSSRSCGCTRPRGPAPPIATTASGRPRRATGAGPAALPLARACREGEALDVARQPDPRREHDPRMLAGAVQPVQAAVGNEAEVEGHSSPRISSRSVAAASNASSATARCSRTRRSWSFRSRLHHLRVAGGVRHP